MNKSRLQSVVSSYYGYVRTHPLAAHGVDKAQADVVPFMAPQLMDIVPVIMADLPIDIVRVVHAIILSLASMVPSMVVNFRTVVVTCVSTTELTKRTATSAIFDHHARMMKSRTLKQVLTKGIITIV
jgi:hypothetical protein